jgi:hypothetical protein
MKIREFLPESWWKDLDPGFLGMMGYSREESVEETDLESDSIEKDVEAIRGLHRPRRI